MNVSLIGYLFSVYNPNQFKQDHILETSKLSTSPKSGTTMKEVDEKITHVISDTILCAWKDMQLVS